MEIIVLGCLPDRYPSCHSTCIVVSLKGAQIIDPALEESLCGFTECQTFDPPDICCTRKIPSCISFPRPNVLL